MSLPPLKTSLAILFIGAMLVALGFFDEFEQFASLRTSVLAEVFDFHLRPDQLPQIAEAPVRTLPPRMPAHAAASKMPPARDLEDAESAFGHLIDRHEALGPFYESLARTANGDPGAVTTVLHFGDSPTTADEITADARALLQRRFGDAGHGFVLIAKPWAWYGHRGVEMHTGGWHWQAVSQNHAPDGLAGLGGVSFEGNAGAYSRYELAEPHQRMELSYLRMPGGGAVEVSAADTKLGEVSTDGPADEDGWTMFHLPPGTRDIELRVTAGHVRLFGVSFEKNGPGVRYDSLGLNGGQVQMMIRYLEPTHWAEQLRHAHPQLVVINYGTNESGYADYIHHQYEGELRVLIRRVRNAVPEASVLIMSPMDRGERNAHGEIVTMPALPDLVDIQRRVAADTGCAFFNTFLAMGGAGTMARWYEERPRLVSADYMHPLPAGAKRVGTLLEEALYQGFWNYERQKRQRLAMGGAGPK
jgi:lysophospholipase L1-like esterase